MQKVEFKRAAATAPELKHAVETKNVEPTVAEIDEHVQSIYYSNDRSISGMQASIAYLKPLLLQAIKHGWHDLITYILKYKQFFNDEDVLEIYRATITQLVIVLKKKADGNTEQEILMNVLKELEKPIKHVAAQLVAKEQEQQAFAEALVRFVFKEEDERLVECSCVVQ